MLSEEIQKRVTDGALRYFTPEQLAQRTRFDDDLDFLESLESQSPKSTPETIRFTVEGSVGRKITITIE